MIKVNWFEKRQCHPETLEMIDSFNENFQSYLNRAAAGRNKYRLEIDKRWANFIYKSSKMTLIKLLAILIAIAPSFTKLISYLTALFVIKGCYLENNPNVPLALGECVKHNGNSIFYKVDWLSIPAGLTALETLEAIFSMSLFFLFILLPHLLFFFLIWLRFSWNKYALFISAAKIQLLTELKQRLATGSYGLLFCMASFIYFSTRALAIVSEIIREDVSVPYNDLTRLIYTFEKDSATSPLALLSTGLLYSCLLIVMLTQIRQPMSLFTGFREYLKEASRVHYNVATVHYRIGKDPVTWKFIGRYYQECERYDKNIVLIAMTTHFIDLGLLGAEGEDEED